MGESSDELPGEKRDEKRKNRYQDRRDRTSMDEFARKIAEANGTSVEILQEPGRSQPETSSRQRAMVRMYEEGYGPTEIVEYFDRNKGSVVHAVKKFGEE